MDKRSSSIRRELALPVSTSSLKRDTRVARVCVLAWHNCARVRNNTRRKRTRSRHSSSLMSSGHGATNTSLHISNVGTSEQSPTQEATVSETSSGVTEAGEQHGTPLKWVYNDASISHSSVNRVNMVLLFLVFYFIFLSPAPKILEKFQPRFGVPRASR